jgi:hypothetical protein
MRTAKVVAESAGAEADVRTSNNAAGTFNDRRSPRR